MHKFPLKLEKSLQNRKDQNAFRTLGTINSGIDFSTNDYLGFAKNPTIYKNTQSLLDSEDMILNGATGSRLLSGNHKLYPLAEKLISNFHASEAALIFNSGYDANIGFFSAVPQRGDVIFYDELVHASIRDGITMSHARSFKFKHNDLGDLKKKMVNCTSEKDSEIYLVTESVFSMDGDSPDIKEFVAFTQEHKYRLVIDEAHALGVFGENGIGLVQQFGIEKEVFARIITFGKALGCHGAVILGSELLKHYLVNFCRSFIYTTALPPHSVANIISAYQALLNLESQQNSSEIQKLQENIRFFNAQLKENLLQDKFIYSNSAIHCCIISGNNKVKEVALHIQNKGFYVKPILSPTVISGSERLRICLHSYNNIDQIKELIELLRRLL
tara:strand:+ start:142411 stop:143571 length:1161 start_codon:yes stop_codon:yes gene_type:complete